MQVLAQTHPKLGNVDRGELHLADWNLESEASLLSALRFAAELLDSRIVYVWPS